MIGVQKIIKFILVILGCLVCSYTAYAYQSIEVVGGNKTTLPVIAIVKFTANSSTTSLTNGTTDGTDIGQYLTSIIVDDLKITGEFNPKEYDNASEIESSAKYVLTGSINNSQLTLILKHNLAESTSLLAANITITPSNIRNTAHTASNKIYQKLTNTPGVFTSKIAYILHSKEQYQIVVADYDGHNQKVILSTDAPLMSLRFNHDGRQIAYVSFEPHKPVVYVQDLYQAKRYLVADFSGSNSSPDFSPDDQELAVTLTKDYGSHIFWVRNQPYNRKTSIASSLIHFGDIDTEADISKNGTILFTSDRDGGPQVFMTHLQEHDHITPPVRLTINLGNYNTSGRLSHDGSKITFVNRTEGVLRTFVMNLATKLTYPVSLNTNLDMAPSFAPNDKLILFSSDSGMYIVNTTGTVQTKLSAISGEIIDEEWANQ